MAKQSVRVQFDYNGKRYKLRTAGSKTMPMYVYHVLSVCGYVVEVPCLQDGHSVARMVIDGQLTLDDFPRYTGDDERAPEVSQ